MKTKHHGRETREHYALKQEIARAYRQAGFPVVVTEQNHCDVVASQIRDRARVTYCIEVERSDKNVLRNVRRNLSLRCDRVVLVCINPKVERAVQERLSALTSAERNLIHITTAEKFKTNQML